MPFLKNIDRTTVWLLIITAMLCAFPWNERSSTWGIILLVIHYVADKNLLSKVKRFRWHPVIVCSFLFLGFHLIALLWSPYREIGWRSIETKLSLLILPFILSTENYLNRKNKRSMMSVFLLSCSLAFLYDLGYSIYHYHAFGIGTIFHRMNISEGLMHPGYFSNYFAFAVLYLSYELWSTRRKPSYLYLFYLLLFLATILLMISKTVVLFLLLLAFYFIWQSLMVVKNLLLRMISFIVVLCLFSTVFYFVPPIHQKVNEIRSEKFLNNENPNYAHSTETRFVGYRHEWELIMQKPITGYGTGAANPVFHKRLEEMKYTSLLENNMHTHQQFFHSWLDMGIVGLILLIGLCVALIYSFIREEKPLGFWMSLLFLFTMLTDDALEIQAMGVFFVLVTQLLLFSKKKEKRSYSLP